MQHAVNEEDVSVDPERCAQLPPLRTDVDTPTPPSSPCASCSAPCHCRLRGQADCTPRVRIAHTSDAQYTKSRANMFRLLHAAQEDESNHNNNDTMMAKKALQYRNMLDDALAADMADPAFEIADFLRVANYTTEEDPVDAQ